LTKIQMTSRRTGAARGAIRALMIGGAVLVLAPLASAQQTGQVEMHGFGGWAYAQTDDNSYLIGSKGGNYDNLSLALNINAKVNDNLTVVGQFELAQMAGFPDEEESLDFAFAEWKFSDAMKLRAGRVKHPFGLYGETFNVGTLRPFFMLPQSIYGPERFTARSVDGISLTGSHNLKKWGLSYDLYGGRINGKFRITGAQFKPEERQLGLYEASFGFDEVIGARLNVQTPIDGLMFGGSGYRGIARGYFSNGTRETAVGGHLEYVKGPALLRVEYGTILNEPITRFDCLYAEGAYKVWKGLQLALRYDSWEGHIKNREIFETAMPWILKIQDSHDFGAGINYWLNPAFVFKVNYHSVRGNRYATPASDEVLTNLPTTGQIRRDTKMVVIGAQFSF
jgi:hypothetical protein